MEMATFHMKNSFEDSGIQIDILSFIFRDELTERRKNMVEKAFRMLDRDNSGMIQINDLGKLVLN